MKTLNEVIDEGLKLVAKGISLKQIAEEVKKIEKAPIVKKA
jgi:orotate phosphoribosyltransferase-like protein